MNHYSPLKNRLKWSREDTLQAEEKRRERGKGEGRDGENREREGRGGNRMGRLCKFEECQGKINMFLSLTRTVATILLGRGTEEGGVST